MQLTYKGNINIYGSRDATKEAFSYGLITNGQIWMEMIKSRNMSSHTYNRDTAKSIIHLVVNEYIIEFNYLLTKMNELKETEN